MFESSLLINEVQQLALLADRLKESGNYEAATEATLLALRLRPSDPDLRRQFEEALEQYIRTERHPSDSAVPIKFVRRRVIDSAHFLGLAHLYVEQRKTKDAIECLEVAKSLTDTNPSLYKLHGRILLERSDFEGASAQLEIALLYNPFDRESAELLAQSESALERYRSALKATIHSYTLLKESDRDEARELRERMQDLTELLRWDKRAVQKVFRERQEYLKTCFDRLKLHRQEFVEQRLRSKKDVPEVGVPHEPIRGSGNRLRMASSLRNCPAINHLSDDIVFRLSEIVEERVYSANEHVLSLGSEGNDICFLLRGRAAVEYPSAYGPIRFSDLQTGSLFGERNYITKGKRYGHVVSLEPCRVMHLDGDILNEWIAESPELGVQVFWCLWHELAQKLRSTNERMRAFVSDSGVHYHDARVKSKNDPKLSPDEISAAEKIAVFREQGLSGRDIDALAEFSKQLEYPKDSYVFREGDYGDEMYVIVDGRVIISKQIPGGGEEALSILKRGEFFGEMSLLDGQPRSADARVDNDDTVILSMSRANVDRALSMDPHQALRLLQLLCGLLARRSREIDHKIVTWSIIASQQQSSFHHLQIS